MDYLYELLGLMNAFYKKLIYRDSFHYYGRNDIIKGFEGQLHL